jgi:hypothetical protein
MKYLHARTVSPRDVLKVSNALAKPVYRSRALFEVLVSFFNFTVGVGQLLKIRGFKSLDTDWIQSLAVIFLQSSARVRQKLHFYRARDASNHKS